MKYSSLSPELHDFSSVSLMFWRIRRIVIGLLLMIYSCYVIFVTFCYAINSKELLEEILKHDPLSLQMIDGYIKLFSQPLIVMISFGLMGGVYTCIRTFVSTAKREFDMPVVWYLTRPLQSVLLAIFIYFAFVAGQVIFYGGSASNIKDINIFSISLLAILAGMFTEQTYLSLKTISKKVIPAEK